MLIAGVLLILASLATLRLERGLPQGTSIWRASRAQYFLIVRVQYAAIAVAFLLAVFSSNLRPYLLIAIAIINGVHFLAFGRLFSSSQQYAKGTLLIVIGLATLLLPRNVSIGHHQVLLWFTVPGYGSLLVLWASAIISLIGVASGLHALRRQARHGDV